jgi:hypothetical protein
MKIIMSESFEDKPFTGKGRNLAICFYHPATLRAAKGFVAALKRCCESMPGG